MERKTFLKSSLAVAAAAIPGMGAALPRALASDALKKKVTITWWGWGDPPVHRNVTSSAAVSHNSPNDAVKVFYERSHPGVAIDTTSYPYPDYVTALKTAFAGGNEPDTVELEPGPLVTEYQPYVLPLDAYAARRWGPNWRQQFYPLAIEQTLGADPKHKTMYALPIGMEVGTALYYNTAIFKQYNLRPPRSYADLKHIADILNSHTITPIAWGAKDGWPNFDWYRMLVEQTAPGVWDAALAGRARFTNPGLVQALEILVKMQKDRIFSTGAWGTTAYPEAITLFQSGKAAMYNTGSWDLLGFATAKVGDTLGLVPLPPMARGLKSGRMFGTTNMMAAASKAARNPQAAFDFIAWQADAGQQATWVNQVGFLPSRHGMHTAPMPNAHYQTIEAYFLKALPTAVIRYNPLLTAQLQKATEDAVANASTLGMSPDKALRSVQAVYDASTKK